MKTIILMLFLVAGFTLMKSEEVTEETYINVDFGECDGYEGLQCTVHGVRVSPCPKHKKSNACIVKRNEVNKLQMNFTPDFDASEVKVTAYAENFGGTPFAGMNTNACDFMTCPVVKGQSTAYNYELIIGPGDRYPPEVVIVKWLMTVNDEPKCCFTNKLKIDKLVNKAKTN